MILKQHSQRPILLLFSFLMLTVLLTPSFTAAHSERSSEYLASPGTKVFRSDNNGLHFQLHTAPFQMDNEGNIEVQGLEQKIQEPGSPALPYYSTFIALPPQAVVSVSVTESGFSRHQPIDVPPVPEQQLWAEGDSEGILAANPETIIELEPLIREDEEIYTLDAPYPKNRFELSEPLYLRDLRIVELKLFPLRYNPYRKTMTQATDLSIQLTFSGAELNNLNPSPGYVDNQGQALRDSILNFDQSHNWRSLPLTEGNEEINVDLPIGINTFKILVDQDGVYEVTADDLKLQGMTLPVDPAAIQMMHGGLPVAFQFIDVNGGGQFDEGDKLYFYGWAFDGSRYEQMYVNDNVFWLWAGGSAEAIPVRDNEAGTGSVVTNFVDSVTRHDENDNFSGWAVQWENEPTIWHSDLINALKGVTESRAYDIDLPDPDPAATDNSIIVELTTRLNGFTSILPTYFAKTFINNDLAFGERNWNGRRNVNVTHAVSGSELKQPVDAGYPSNQVTVEFSSDSATSGSVYLTRITIEYKRLLKALNDQLIFSTDLTGQHDFHVSGFSSGEASSAIVWDISDRYQPEQIRMQPQNIQGGGGNYTYVVGRTHSAGAQFIATTTNNILTVKDISSYNPVPLYPDSVEAQWLAITHSSLRNAADALAAHRAEEFSTFVIDIENLTNQVGYGFNSPQTIRNYLFYALTNWAVAPEYVTLFGDATRNPLNQECPLCGVWDKDAPTLIVTDFTFVDRWNGMIPSDFTMSLLVGNDLLPDIAIGRMAANNLNDANHMVQKVISYETQRDQEELEDWQRNFLFVADDPDAGGNFCVENLRTGNAIPKLSYNQTHLCLPAPTVVDTESLRIEMAEQINDIGTSVLNYRGHGSPGAWAGSSGSPSLLTSDDTDFWQNVGRPVVILSADCLDGYFIYTHTSALGETFHRLNNRGSVAHWSSSGLGFSSEHTALHSGYYAGVFMYRYKEIGKAINFAKIQYYLSGQYPSELYSFILLGDPALKILPEVETDSGIILLPAVMARDA